MKNCMSFASGLGLGIILGVSAGAMCKCASKHSRKFRHKTAKAKIKGSPSVKGLTIIWDLEKDGDSYSGGEILDPTKGKVYGCEMWREGEKLIVRGKIAFLGRNQTWLPNKSFKGDGAVPTPKKPAL